MNGEKSPAQSDADRAALADAISRAIAGELRKLDQKLGDRLEKLPSIDAQLAGITTDLDLVKAKVAAISPASSSSAGRETVLKAIGAIVLALATGWWSSYLISKSTGLNKLHETINARAGEAYLDCQRLVDQIETDFEGFCLDTRQDTKESDGHAAKFRGLIDGGPFPERVNESLRNFNNYVQETMALKSATDLSPEEKSQIRSEARRRRGLAAEALRSWAGE